MNIEGLLKELKIISKNLENLSRSINNIINILEDNIENKHEHLERFTSDTNEVNEKTVQIFEEFFLNRRCEIVRYTTEEPNRILTNISKFIGNKYSYIREFLKELKKSLNTGKQIKLFLKDARQEEISYTCQLAKNLYDIAFLESYSYINAPKYILLADTIREPEVIKFINGHWLELFIINKIKEILSDRGLIEGEDYFYIYNIQIKLPNGNYSELDILFKIKEVYYWIEAKTGEYQRYVHKYSDLTQLFNLSKENTFLLITEITDAGAEAVSDIFKMTVTNLNTFEKKFLESLEKEI